MSADPADIAKATSDGIVLTITNPTIQANHPDARDLGDTYLEMFFVNEADAVAVLNQRFQILSQINAPHLAVVTEETLGLGQGISVLGVTPCFQTVDARRGIDQNLRTRSFAHECGSDQYSIEVMG
jgi:hypothetical protein